MSGGFFVMGDFDSKFMQDHELRSLLRQWSAPGVPNSLDNRVASTYHRVMQETAALNSAFHSQRDSEVVAMKFCSTCQEQFADRFSFCPVDGTPLEAALAPPVITPASNIETSYPVAEQVPHVNSAPEPARVRVETPAAHAPAFAAAANVGEFHLTILEDAGLISRLAGELGNVAHNYQLTWPEFKRDPFGFVKRSVQGYGQIAGRFFRSRDVVLASLISVVALAAVIAMIFVLDRTQTAGPSRKGIVIVALIGFCGLLGVFATWLSRDRGAAVMGARPSDSRNVLSGIVTAFAVLLAVVFGAYMLDRRQQAKAAAANADDVELTQMITDIPNEQPTPDEGTAGMAKGNGGGSKPKQEKAGGGGGGGREEKTDASFGKLPQADFRISPVAAPAPHSPLINNPALPMTPTLAAAPALFPPDTRNLNYGDPKSRSTTPSSGPGSGNGIGSGNGGAGGPGNGGGYGPGKGGRTAGGHPPEGPPRPRGRGGATPS